MRALKWSCAIEIFFNPGDRLGSTSTANLSGPLGVKLGWIGYADYLADPNRPQGFICFWLGSDHSY